MNNRLREPVVSIITPSVNMGSFIERCIQSVLAQNYQAVEHIIVDGGSADETLSIIEKYKDKLRWISEPDHGQSDAMNKGIHMAKGEIIGWINADDYYLASVIPSVVKEFVVCPDVFMVHGDARMEDPEGRILKHVNARDVDIRAMLRRNQICYPVFIRRVVFDDIGGFDEGLHLSMDYEMWIRLMLRYKTKHVPIQIAAVTLHPSSKSICKSYAMTLEAVKVKMKYLSMPYMEDILGGDYLIIKQFSNWELGWFNFQSGNRIEARRWLIRTIVMQPMSIYSVKALAVLLVSLLGKSISENVVSMHHHILNPIAISMRKVSRRLRGKQP